MNRTVVGLGIFLAGCLSVSAQEVRIQGADSMLFFGQRIASVLSAKKDGQKLRVRGGSTAAAFQALLNGEVEVAQTPRLAMPAEQGKAKGIAIAVESVAVFVNPGNRVKQLSLAQIRSIFTGDINNWKQVGGADKPIQLYSTESAFGGSVFFQEAILQGREFDTTMRGFDNAKAAIAAVQADSGGIGFAPFSADPKVKWLAIQRTTNSLAVEATSETIRGGIFPISRKLYWYAATADSRVNQLFQWVLSPQGQLVVESVGYYPLLPQDRAAGLERLKTMTSNSLAGR